MLDPLEKGHKKTKKQGGHKMLLEGGATWGCGYQPVRGVSEAHEALLTSQSVCFNKKPSER